MFKKENWFCVLFWGFWGFFGFFDFSFRVGVWGFFSVCFFEGGFCPGLVHFYTWWLLFLLIFTIILLVGKENFQELKTLMLLYILSAGTSLTAFIRFRWWKSSY